MNTKKKRGEALLAYIFLTPLVLFLVLMMLLPLLSGLQLSFLDRSGDFVGLTNFKLFIGEPRFTSNLMVTVQYVAINVTLVILLGLLAAHLITEKSRFVNFIRPLYLIPWIIPPVASSILFKTLYDANTGPVPLLIKKLTGLTIMPLASADWSLTAVIIHDFWRSFPFAMLFLAAGLTTIPHTVFEAATIDGASRWKQFTAITVPMMRTHIFIVTLMVTNSTMQSSESIYSLTKGGPGYATETIAVRMFKDAFIYFDINTGATMGMFLLGASGIFMLLYSRLLKTQEENYE